MAKAQMALAALLGLAFAPGQAGAAETCFHACVKGKLIAPDIDDQTIRDNMQFCKKSCDEEELVQLEASGTAEKITACTAEKLDDSDFKKVRSASPSVVAYANSFTWDVQNVLPDKIIKRVEITTQNLSLEDVTISAGAIVEPGKSATFLSRYVADGYPSMRVTTRIKAIYACDLGAAAEPKRE